MNSGHRRDPTVQLSARLPTGFRRVPINRMAIVQFECTPRRMPRGAKAGPHPVQLTTRWTFPWDADNWCRDTGRMSTAQSVVRFVGHCVLQRPHGMTFRPPSTQPTWPA